MTPDSVNGIICSNKAVATATIRLYQSAGVQNANEAITVVYHALMLENGFLPKDVSDADKYECMPKDWNANGIFKIKYEHFCCPSYTCYMTCVPLYNNISAHGIICDTECSESVDTKISVKKYVKEGKDLSNMEEAFPNFEELSRCFKDNFCLPLLNLLHETSGEGRFYGIRGLMDELKVYILEYLPVGSVLSMSVVNKNFNSLIRSPLLWKHLYLRDFAKGGVPDIDTSSTDINWKEMYVKEHKKKTLLKQRAEERAFMMPRYRMPPFLSVGPDSDSDLSIHFDPPPPALFPSLPNCFPNMLPRHLFRRL